jgi:hypothetical protein
MPLRSATTFDNEFDLTERSLDEVIIKETNSKDKCLIWDKKDSTTAYNRMVLSKNSQSKIVCELSFYKSGKTNKYIPRPTFKRIAVNGDIRKTTSADKVTIRLADSEDAETFWNLINFLISYKELVETGEFAKSFKVIPKESYLIEFKNKSEQQRFHDLKELIGIAELSTSAIKSLTFESRKQNLKAFYYLLKNETLRGYKSHDYYKEKYTLSAGEEYIWHHFLKRHDWILGLNLDIRFIIDFLDEQKVGMENSKGQGNPQTDLLGVSDFTTLVELKHTNTDIFKKTKQKGRANTWDFTSDFIEGISQCLGQKFELDKVFDQKAFINSEGSRLDKKEIQSVDPKSILLIGNKKREFPLKDSNDENLVKNKTLQRFRRNNRNIEVLTYDELFERAYQIVYSRKLDKNWYWQKINELFD